MNLTSQCYPSGLFLIMYTFLNAIFIVFFSLPLWPQWSTNPKQSSNQQCFIRIMFQNLPLTLIASIVMIVGLVWLKKSFGNSPFNCYLVICEKSSQLSVSLISSFMCQQSPNLEAFNLEEAIISSHRTLSTAKVFPLNKVVAISRKHSLKPTLLCLGNNESLKSRRNSWVKLCKFFW